MYNTEVNTQGEALCHLLFHCCLKDGRFEKGEIDKVSDIFIQFDLQHELNFKKEVIKYRQYAPSITDDKEFIDYLLKLIMPVNELALFSWCVELTLSDNNLSLEEEVLLDKVGAALEINREEIDVIKKLMIQRSIVISEKIC